MADEQTSSSAHEPRAILYDASGHDRECDMSQVDLDSLGEEQLLWIDLSESGSEGLSALPDKLGRRLQGWEDVGPLQVFEDFYRFAVPRPQSEDVILRFVIGQSWIVTSCEKRPDFFDKWIEADQGETLKGRMTSTAFMAALLMRHFDEFREQIASVDVAVDRLDEIILRSREKKSPLLTLAALRRRLARLRSLLKDHRSAVRGLIGPEFLAQVNQSDRDFLAEVNRLFERLEDDVGRARETVIGSFELYASRVAQDTNQLIKILTIATVITGIVGAVAGVFGMNFDTPVSHSGLHGFLIVTGLMVASSAAIVAVAVWRRWV